MASLALLVGCALVLVGCSSGDEGGSQMAPLATGGAATPQGFETVAVRAEPPGGAVCESCMWLAKSGAERARGLMAVTALGGADGMVFRYDDEGHRSFWMKDTLIPLSIAFVDGEGVVVDVADMQPCTGDPCPSHGSDEPFELAIEVPQGEAGVLGLTVGSIVELIGPCPD